MIKRGCLETKNQERLCSNCDFSEILWNSTWKFCGLLSASKILATGLHLSSTKKGNDEERTTRKNTLHCIEIGEENNKCLLVLTICLKDACAEVDSSASSGCGSSTTSGSPGLVSDSASKI